MSVNEQTVVLYIADWDTLRDEISGGDIVPKRHPMRYRNQSIYVSVKNIVSDWRRDND